MSAVIENHHDDHHHGPAKGLTRWLYTTNHKDIGTLYLWFSFAMFLIGGAMALVIRAELFQPGMQIVEPEFYNQMITLHGLIMIFGGVMPAFVGLANWLVPMMIGAPDMALPRMNNLSFWILPFAFFILLSSLFMEGGAPNFGWTFYAPLSTTYAPPSVTFFIFSVHIMGASSIMGAINVVVTIMNMRAPGVTLIPDSTEYPTQVTHASGKDDTFVGRVREDISHPNGINLWVVADNIRKGAALNSIQIAEVLIADYL